MRKNGWCRTFRGRWNSFTMSCGALIYCKKLLTFCCECTVLRFWSHILLWCSISQGLWRRISFLSSNIKRKEAAGQTPPLPVTWYISAYPGCGDQTPSSIDEQRYRWGLEHVILFYLYTFWICDHQALTSLQALPILYPSLRAVIDRLAFSQLIRILKEFTASLPDSKDTCLTLACQNKVSFYSCF